MSNECTNFPIGLVLVSFDMNNKLLENSRVRITTAIVAAVFVTTVIVGETIWKCNVSRDLRDMRINLERLDNNIVGKSPNGWHRTDMAQWVRRTERENTEWRAADVYKD